MGVPGYNRDMFVRRKKNASGSVSVQIISKWRGEYKVVYTVGSARERKDIERLVHDMYEITYQLPRSHKRCTMMLGMTDEQRRLWEIMQMA